MVLVNVVIAGLAGVVFLAIVEVLLLNGVVPMLFSQDDRQSRQAGVPKEVRGQSSESSTTGWACCHRQVPYAKTIL